MVNSPNFINSQPAIIGTVNENPSILNINDAAFSKDETLNQDIAEWKYQITERPHKTNSDNNKQKGFYIKPFYVELNP